MALSNITYTANGITTIFVLPFTYIEQADITVTVDDVVKVITTDYTFNGSGDVVFNTAPLNLEVVYISRDSDVTQRVTTYADGSSLTEEDLNNGGDQSIYLHQETRDQIDTINTDNVAIIADVATNAADIVTNAADIATNAADISTNTSDIVTNTVDIATNAADIITNTSKYFDGKVDVVAGVIKGQPVFISGSQGTQIQVQVADNTDYAAISVVALATEVGANNVSISCQTHGLLTGLDTSAFTTGDIIYLDAGTLTSTHPTGINAVVIVGYAVKINPSTGSIFIQVSSSTLADNDDATVRQQVVNSSSGTNAAASNTLINDLSHRASMAITGSNYNIIAGIAEALVVYNEGYNKTVNMVDGNFGYEWRTDVGDTHDLSATSKMELSASGNLTISGTVDGRDVATDGSNQDAHIASTANPHSVTKAQVGLTSVDDTSDLDKPVSNATQTALDLKQDELITTRGDVIVGDATGASSRLAIGAINKILVSDGTDVVWGDQAASGGDVAGGVSSVDNGIARHDGTTGKLIQDSAVTIDDDGRIEQTGLGNSVFIGIGAGEVDDLTANKNLAIGNLALNVNVAGANNTCVGDLSGAKISGGNSNTFFGASSASTGTTLTGSRNTGLGYHAFQDVYSTSSDNVGLGADAGKNATVAHRATIVGSQCGTLTTAATDLILIGYGIEAPTPTTSNYMNIGNVITADLAANLVSLYSGVGVSSILDDDTMAADSATALATQQSIKAYADTKQSDVITTEGDLVLGNVSNVASRLAIGTANKLLTSNGTTATWEDPPAATPSFATVTKTTAATLSTSGEDNVLANGTFTITLPAVSGNSGLIYRIANIGTGVVTIEGNASETIGGELNVVMGSKGDSIIITTDGLSWYYISDDVTYSFSRGDTSGQTINSSLSAMTFNSVDHDTHSAFSGSTYTIPIDGKYDISAYYLIASTLSTTQFAQIRIYVGGVERAYSLLYGNGSAIEHNPRVHTKLSLSKGDLVTIHASTSVSTTANSNQYRNNFSISRIK